MSRDRKLCLLRNSPLAIGALLFGLALSAAVAVAPELPVGTLLHVRLSSSVSSKTSRAGQPVSAVSIAPVYEGERLVLPFGCTLSGVVGDAHSADEATGDRAMLSLDFRELAAPGGYRVTFAGRVHEIDNARETVDADGRITGIDAKETLTAEADKGIGKLAENHTQLAGLLSAVKSAMVKPADPEIEYPAGTELTLAVTKKVSLTGAPVFAGPALAPFSSADGLRRMVVDQPIRAFSAESSDANGRPSDLTNVLIVGTEQQLRDAFRDAGWVEAAALSRASKIETVRAVMEGRGYKEGPVSLLVMEGRPPDLVFEKTNDTFAMRHHLRVWRRPGVFDGTPIWLIAATHDTGIDFSQSDLTFTHKIDSNIDREREKVVNDLLFTGHVRSLEFADRRNIPLDATNATGDRLNTDGRLAILKLGS